MKNKILSEEIGKLTSLITERMGEYNKKQTYTPPDNVVQIAKSALAQLENNSNHIEKGTDQGSGMQKARQLANKKPQNMAQLKKIQNFFNTHAQTVSQIKNQGGPKTTEQVGIMQAWSLHGGDPGKQWVNSELSKHHDMGTRKQELMRNTGGAATNKGTGVFDSTIMDPTKLRISR